MDLYNVFTAASAKAFAWKSATALLAVFALHHTAFASSTPDNDITKNAAVQCAPAALTLAEYYAVSNSGSGHTNRCPTADAGQDLQILPDQAVPLNASSSTDMDGQRLSFHWSRLEAPQGSAAQPASPNSITTDFVPDLVGDYVFELTVTDSDGASSIDRVRFSMSDVAPVANAGPDITASLGESIQLDAIRSYDLNDNHLSYHWSVIEKPAVSRSQISSANQSRAALSLDADGDYVIELVVHNGKYASVADTLRISTVNSMPTAHAGRARTLAPDSTLILDSERSHDVDNDALAYHWSLLSAPSDSQLDFDDPLSASPTVKLGGDGLYLFQLMVDDGQLISTPSTVLVNVDSQRLTGYDIKDFLSLTTRGAGDDTDGDGVMDPVDNCVLVANAPQRDTDGDGIGNFCDPDLNNDGVVNFLDITLWTPFFMSNDEDTDFNGDGNVNFLDYFIITNAFLQPPGPPGTIIWVSLVDGDWGNRLNWDPQVVPTAGVNAIIDLAGADVTVTLSGGSGMVKNLVQNETLVLSTTTFEATGAVELGGAITGTTTTINNTQFVPSMAGSGTITLNTSTHTWSGNTLGVNTLFNNGANVNNSNGLVVNAALTIDAPSSPTGLFFINDQTVSGSGTIILDGVGNSQITEPRLFPSNFSTLTFAPGLTIEGGKGTVGQVSATLVMNASLNANVSGESLRIGGTLWTGTGTLMAQNGGNLQLFGNFDNGGGTLSLDSAGGSINLQASAALRNATLNGAPGTDLTINSGTTNFENLVVNADLNMVNGAITNVTGGLTLTGDAFIDAPSSPTGFQFVDTQTLGGTGTITIDGVGNSQISEPRLFPFNFTTLTVAPGITIRGGKATIGQVSANLVLLGDVIADVSGETVLIAGTTWSSAASMSAINGGALNFSGNFDNSGNPLTLDTGGGSVNLLNGASLRNMTINGAAGTELTINTGTTNLEAITFNGDIDMINGAISNVSGGLTINGNVLFNASSSPTGFQFIETQTLGGNVTIVIDGTGNSISSEPRLFPFNFTTLTVGPDVTIRGGNGTVGQISATLIMLGDLIADVDGEELLIGGSSWSANSSIQAINNGEVRFFGNFDNGTNALSLDTAGGFVELLNGASLSNATINGTAGTDLLVRTGTTTLNAMTFNHDLTYQNGAISNIAGGLTLNGTANINAPSSPTGLQFTETQSLLGTASIVFDGATNSVISEPRLFPFNFTTLTIGPSISISGGKATIGQVSASLVMNGSINADVNGQALFVTGSWSGTGTLAANNGGIIQLGGTLDNANQTVNFDTDGGSTVLLNGSSLRNATLSGTAGTSFNFNTGTHTFENLTVDADIDLSNGALVNVTSGLTLNGTALINAPTSPTGFVFVNDQTLGGAATITFNGAGNSVISEPRLFPLNFTTLTIASTVTVNGGIGTIGQVSADINNQGTISADVDDLNVIGVLNNGAVEAFNGAFMTISSFLPGAGDLHAGAGSTLSFSQALTLGSGNDVFIDIASPVSVGTITTGANNAIYAGTITVSAVDGYMPNLSDSFVILQHGSTSGTFSTVNSVGLGGGQSFGLTYTALDVTATVN